MKLRVENFGPIRKAEVALGPMTVFVGPSNTGKTYLAILIYSVMEALANSRLHGTPAWLMEDYPAGFGIRPTKSKREELRKKPAQAFAKVKKTIEESFVNWTKEISDGWERKVAYCFGGQENLNLLIGDDTVVKVSDDHGDLLLDLCEPDKSRIRTRLQKNLFKSVDEEILVGFLCVLESDFGKDRDGVKEEAKDTFAEMFFPKFSSKLWMEQKERRKYDTVLHIRSHYLPAIRGGVMQSHRTLVGAMIAQAPMAGLREMSSISRFTGVLADFMQKLLNIGVHVRGRGFGRARMSGPGKIRDVAEAIGKKIMHGKIQISRKSPVNYPDFHYAFKGDESNGGLPLLVASSMVSELAPVFLFLQYYVGKGDLFILEEPEAHLHPGAQREIANTLVQLVNAGVHVLITTHSDIILEQIGNYVQAAEVGKKVRGQSLAKEKNSTYYFSKPKSGKQKKTKVEKVEFKPEIGFLTKDHLAVSSALYNETVSLLEAGDKS